MKLNVTFEQKPLKLEYTPPVSLAVSTESVAREYVERDPYFGDYTVVPSAEAQTLHTNGFRMTSDVVVAAIPNNYGLVTWNGAFLTVS